MIKLTVVFPVFLLFLMACGGKSPADEKAVSVRPTRQANVAHYMQKAKQNSLRAQERRKPLDIKNPVNTANLNVEMAPETIPDLPAQMQAVKTNLERRVRQAYGDEAAARAGALIMEYHLAATQAAKTVSSPAQLAEKLKELDGNYQQKLNAFLQKESLRGWFPPSKKQLAKARAEMSAKNKAMQAEIKNLYGAPCAEKAAPVLNKALEDYLAALSTAKTGEELEKQVGAVSVEADVALRQLVAKYGDPKGAMSEDELQAMRAEMIAAYQEVEARFEYLYGKEAVLEIRPFFNQILKNAAAVGAADTRLSYKKEELARLNAIYRQKLAVMQNNFNARLKKPHRPAKAS